MHGSTRTPAPDSFLHFRGTVAPRFGHPSEIEIARIFDFYGIGWEYEPHEFVLERDAAGQQTSSFRPDFFLPDLNLYVETTVMKQSLVSRKNRKVRRTQELYPEVRVKVLYRRDILRLAERFGFEVPAAGLATSPWPNSDS